MVSGVRVFPSAVHEKKTSGTQGRFQVLVNIFCLKISKAHNAVTPLPNKISILLAGVTWI